MVSKELENAINSYEKYYETHGVSEELINVYVMACGTAYKEDIEYGKQVSARAKGIIEQFISDLTGGNSWELEKYAFANKTNYEILDKLYEVLLVEAQNYNVDSGFRYLERKREPNERFYMPRRKQLVKSGIIDGLQGMIDDRYDILCISMPPGTAKTTAEKFFNALVVGWFPKDFNLFYSHSGDITKMYYEGMLDIIGNNDEYTWSEIFPGLSITKTDAKMEQFNVGKYKAFPSVQCTSVGSKNAGKVRASKFLLVDDMIGGIEEALNPTILEKLWNKYSVDARQRKIQGCKEIHIATRWSVKDVIGRIIQMYDGNTRVKVISIPDIDPITGKSNFDYEFGGFDEAFFADQQLLMDEISYKCLYKQEPIEREGLLYHKEEMRRYTSLPNREPDAVLGVCDTKTTGVDYMVLTVFYQYDDDYYLVDCVCDDSTDFVVQQEKLAGIILEHNMQQCEFESNAGGSRLAHEVNKIVKERGGRCNVTTKPTSTNKETRIIVNSDWVKKNCLFRDSQDYAPKSDYGRFMSFMFTYSISGKNRFDDVVDCLANFVLYITKKDRVRPTVILTDIL